MGRNREEHNSGIGTGSAKIQDHGIRLTFAKCKFSQESVEYLGHRIDATGLHPTKEKVQAVVNASDPRNVAKLKAIQV